MVSVLLAPCCHMPSNTSLAGSFFLASVHVEQHTSMSTTFTTIVISTL
ncbi:hypothetical protein URH17368_2752 [Alicyclobacillus hesperidum URH17-3-68]|nr:hypothetical protein URH17368_2752 [Alicyclobacillus hesperidum URH17-3-68]